MKSLDNLREYVLTAPSICSTTRAILVGYIDNIEREVEELRDREYRNGMEDGEMAAEREVKELTDERDLLKRQWEAGVDFDQRLEACADKRDDVTLFGVDYTPLPLDADGVPIHAGDVMEELSGHTFEVASLMAFGGSDNWLVLSDPQNFSSFREPHDIRHHHAPTVEDVLEEFVARWMETHHDDIPALKAEYAARLRLAGDE